MRYKKLPTLSSNFIKKKKYFFLFETSLCDASNFKSYIFYDPIDVIKINDFGSVDRAFEKIEQYQKRFFVVGTFAYELGYYFEKKSFSKLWSYPFPLIHLAVFDKRLTFDHKTGRSNIFHVPGLFTQKKLPYPKTSKLNYGIKENNYCRAVKSIKNHIRKGDIYQTNFTGKLTFSLRGSPFALYESLKEKQPVPYGSFCKFDQEYIISLSPELFFEINGNRIISKPMKGTSARGKSSDEDIKMAQELHCSPKNRAENIMIVDLVRNDLGRICKTKSVVAKELFKIEKYVSLFQMTSTVTGLLKSGITYRQIFQNIFPGGSITGAPKIRAMQIISKLENHKRNIYCGALGFISPKKRAVFNMPIRTIRLLNGKGEMGIGSGIVSDSVPKSEYLECKIKADFLVKNQPEFDLFETILWQKNYRYLQAHLKRLCSSAEYFNFEFDRVRIMRSLNRAKLKFKKGKAYRVRLLLNRRGVVHLEYKPLDQISFKSQTVGISKNKIDPNDKFYYHKTTNRLLYDKEFKRARKKGYADILFFNKRGELTEGAISNVIIQKNGRLFTPPISSGLLAGTAKTHLLANGKVQERIIKLKDLTSADKIFICNSVRGITQVSLDDTSSIIGK